MEKPVYHRLQRGETLEALSARYRVPVCAIMHANADMRPRENCIWNDADDPARMRLRLA